jgi:glycosyltransferase involved in cell wall biosynthesis
MFCPDIVDLPSPPAGKTGWPWTVVSGLPTAGWSKAGDLPAISIVTPSYNQGNFIEETIRSVLLQGYPNLEYYIMDAGSTDQTLDVLKKYEPWLTGWVSEPDAGQYDAINKGWRLCTGDWLGWMNADDTYLSGALWSLVRGILQCAESGIVVGDAFWTDVAGRVIRHQRVSDFDYINFLSSLSNHLPSGSTLIRRSVVDAIGGLDVSMSVVGDTDLWIRAGSYTKIYTIPETVSTFRYHADCITWRLEKLKGPELIRAYDKLYGQADLPPSVLKIKNRVYSFCYLDAARYACRAGDRRMCWHYLILSFRAGWRYIGFRHLSVIVQSILGKQASDLIRLWLRRSYTAKEEGSFPE